ncbi:hypothetical protein O181_002671 [Austropuccinia psidii MF-1]|uniref:Uncharacterized protein n=1 Tax=Austropuccinia psidii MF-1 TaxID=1389203 RepID=A0A9Q3GDG2_9BASI|nr:hypothetical protein [Austropuccinia psidii MF-1]
MPVQHSPPTGKASFQARAQAVLAPTSRAPLYCIPEVPQLRAHLDKGPNLEGGAPSMKGRKRAKKIKFLFRSNGEEEEENSVEEEDSDGTEGVPAPVGASQGTGGPTLAQSNQPVSHQFETSLLAIIQKMNHIMGNIQ